MTPDASYTDSRLAALYDDLNPFGADTAFYLGVGAGHPGATIVDLGCGTGLLTVELARQGHRTIGVDPAGAMLDIARAREGGDLVEWIQGTSADLPNGEADLAIMTGHVAQVFVADAEWSATLDDLRAALRPGGLLVFESRNPLAAAWLEWTPEDSRTELSAVDGPLTAWNEVTEVADGVVSLTGHYLWATGEHLEDRGTLRFRSEDELRASLGAAGFAVRRIHGDWNGGSVAHDSRELIVEAEAVGSSR